MTNQSNSIKIKARGFYCNDWPNIKILLNDKILYDGKISEQKMFNFENLEFLEKNIFSIVHYGKNFGDNNIWDTEVDENNNVISDRYFIIDDILINSITLKEIWHYGIFDNNEPIVENCDSLFFNFNISYKLEFNSPFYNWLIDKKREGFLEIGPAWKKSALNSLPDGYSISLLKIESLFDDIEQEIKKL